MSYDPNIQSDVEGNITVTGGIDAAGSLQAGASSLIELQHIIDGTTSMGAVRPQYATGDDVLDVVLPWPLTAATDIVAFTVQRVGAENENLSAVYNFPAAVFYDKSASAQSVLAIGTDFTALTMQFYADGHATFVKGLTASNAALTGPGSTTPTLAVTKLAGQTGLLIACTDENDVPKVSIAVDGEIVTADDVLAPTGVIKGATVALYTSGTGAPIAGAHTQGEFHGDTAGALFYCTADGTPGTWKQVTLT